MNDNSDLVECPFCHEKKAGKLDAPEPAERFLLVGYSQKTNTLFPDRGFPVDAYGCVSCKKVWLESPSLKLVDD